MASPLKVSRREWRRILVENWGKPGEPDGMPWYSRGRLIQHFAPTLLSAVAFCGARTWGNSSTEVRTPMGLHCPVCALVLHRIVNRLEAEQED